MRLVDVHLDADRPLHVVLHPRLTVVTGDVVACRRLTEVLARAFALAGSELAGTIEYSGFPSPLDPTTVVSLDLHGEGLLVATPADLPAPSDRIRAEAIAEMTRRRDRAMEAAGSEDSNREALERRVQATDAAVTVGREEQEATRARLAELEAQLSDLGRRWANWDEELTEKRHQAESLRAVLSEQMQLAPEVLHNLDPASGSVRSIRMGMDLRPVRHLIERARGCGLLDDQMAGQLDGWLADVERGKAGVDPTVIAMRDEVAELEAAWTTLASVGVEDEHDVVEARSRHEELAGRLGALEELAKSGVLAERARSEIDSAHAERVRLESARGRGGQLDAAVAHESAVTAKYGFGSHLDYTIALSTRSVGDAVEATLDRVRAETVAASDALDAVRERAASSRSRLAERRAELRARLQEMAGVEASDLSMEAVSRIPALPQGLETIGAQVAQVVAGAQEQLRLLDSHVSEMAAQGSERSAAEAALGVEMAERRGMLEALEPLIERARAQHAEAESELAQADQRAAAAAADLAGIEEQLALLSDAEAGAYGPEEVPMVVNHLLPLVDPAVAEPLPVILADTFRPLGEAAVPALEAMTVAALRVQLIYVTDDPSVVGWARSLTPSAGELVRLQRPGWFQRRLARRSSGSRSDRVGS